MFYKKCEVRIFIHLKTFLINYKNLQIMKQNEILETQTLSEVGEDIGLSEGLQLVKAFRAANPDAVKGYYIGRNIIDQILTQPGCVGINFRKCLTELNQEHLVYTGVDADGKDIITYSVVTNTGDIVNQNGIVADRIWIEEDAVEQATRTIFDY